MCKYKANSKTLSSQGTTRHQQIKDAIIGREILAQRVVQRDQVRSHGKASALVIRGHNVWVDPVVESMKHLWFWEHECERFGVREE